jgi:hypothetical protein
VLALRRSGVPGADEAADRLAGRAREGALRSGWAEYWEPDDARPGGAVPQSWATLATLWEGR